MALFQRKVDTGRDAALYTLGANQTFLIIGLGNPEIEYKGTRHNAGFEVLDFFASANDFPGWIDKKDLKCRLCAHTLGGNRIILCKPTTYVNNSGLAAQAVQRFYRIYNPQTLAVYDELAIPFGQLRTRLGGSDAGHNGVRSLITHIGEDFARLRVGIGSETGRKTDPADFVLRKFSKTEQVSLPKILREANELINDFVFGNFTPQTRKIN